MLYHASRVLVRDNVESADYTDKSAFNWISVIRLPDFIAKKDLIGRWNRFKKKRWIALVQKFFEY